MSDIAVTSVAVGKLKESADSIDRLRLKLAKIKVTMSPTYELFSYIAYIRYQAVKGVWEQQIKKYRSQHFQWLRILVNSVGVLPPPGLSDIVVGYFGGPQLTL